MQQRPRSHALRIGRYSLEGQIYLVTASTAHRESCFLDFGLARQAVLALREEEIMGRARTLSFVVMPDHLHWLLTLTSTAPLGRVVGSVKSVVAHAARRPIWQKGFHDHALRKEEDVVGIARYIVRNPVRAGIVTRAGLYPHWDSIWL